jgi:hypothetical protein
MNKAKKEEIRKYNEARQGKPAEEIAEIDRQDKIDAQIKKLASLLHGRLFPEEYDFMSDSISDAKDRKKGINPMSEEYIKKMDNKRQALGFLPILSSGHAVENETLEFCLKFVKSGFELAD